MATKPKANPFIKAKDKAGKVKDAFTKAMKTKPAAKKTPSKGY